MTASNSARIRVTPSRAARAVRVLAGALLLGTIAAPLALHAQTSAGNDTTNAADNSLLNGPIHVLVRSLSGADTLQIGVGAPTTLVAVFATWCAPCRDEVPVLNMLQRDFGSKVRVIGLSMDGANTQYVQAWLKRYGAQYPVARDDNGVARSLGVAGIPVLYLVNGTGHVEWKRSGSLLSALPELRARLRLLPALQTTQNQ